MRVYGALCVCCACALCVAQAAGAAAGARARRALHERLLHAALHAPHAHYHTTPPGYTLHRFSADILIVDKVSVTLKVIQQFHGINICMVVLINYDFE